jgi:hypothetical protein
MKNSLMVIVCALTLTACSSQYIMSTKDGKMITTDSKPKLDDRTGMYHYYDEEGREVMVKKDEITHILER